MSSLKHHCLQVKAAPEEVPRLDFDPAALNRPGEKDDLLFGLLLFAVTVTVSGEEEMRGRKLKKQRLLW